ncbi:type II toxin-antitoxin system VapC family toxin [Cuspidothrix issatschenkoi LEGE 03284]|nr:type II toxin-antitoxin system VapC family toxin [Cuspidothrix issatschenkoi LEGE 03284]
MVLLDTSGLLCFLHQDEAQHKTAVELISNYNGRFITHNYVLAELIALSLVRRFPCSTVLMYSLELMENPNVEMVWVDEILHREAMDLLLVRQDKTYSLCDAISFVLMRKKGIREALTTDKHFEQEGFTRLLQS